MNPAVHRAPYLPLPTSEGAHPAPSEEPQVSAILLHMIADVAARHQVPYQRLLLQDADAFMRSDPLEHRVPLRRYREVLARAIALTGNPALGLQAGSVSPHAAHLMGPLLAHQADLRHALQALRLFQPLLFEGSHLHIAEQAGIARVTVKFPRDSTDSDRTLAEFIISGITGLLHAFGVQPAELHGAYFEHTRPPYHHDYRRFFTGTARFAAQFTGLEFLSMCMERPNVFYNPALHDLLFAQAATHLKRVRSPSLTSERVARYLRTLPRGASPSLAAAAGTLGLSTRSLRRRLSDEGESFRALVQKARSQAACRMLRNPDLTLQHIAGQLGFADSASFCRSFRKWQGMTASEFRQSELASPAEPPARPLPTTPTTDL